MESAGMLLGVLAFAILIGIPALAIIAIVRVGTLKKQMEAQTPELIRRIYGLERRLEWIEKALAAAAPVPDKQQGEQTADLKPAALPRTSAPAPHAVEAPDAPPIAAQPTVFAPAAAPNRPALPGRQTTGTDPAPPALNFEALVAGRWLNYVGILALLFAVTFFLKYAFDNNWVGPQGRVGIGILLGAALYPWSQSLLNKGYEYFSEGIAALGAATLYLSLWAGWHYYLIFSQSVAFALMIVVTVATFVVAVGRNSERVALLAQIGGLITPLLVSTGENHEVGLFTYLAILGAAVLGLAWVRAWRWLLPLQFGATLVFFWGWYSDFYNRTELGTTILYATIFFLLFAAIPLVRSWREGGPSEPEIGIVVINAAAYLIALHEMLWPQYRWSLTIAVLALAAAHAGAERLLPAGRQAQTRVARILYGGLALTFATLAIPIRCDGKWITLAWAVEGVVLIWSGLSIKFPIMRWAGLLLFVVVTARLAVASIPANTFMVNARFATFAIAVACFFAACYFASESGLEMGAEEKAMYLVTAIAGNVLLVAAFSLEVWDVFGRMPSLGIDREHAQQLALSALWLVYALALLAIGTWKKSAVIRWQGLTLLGVVIVKVFVFDLSFLEKFYRIVSFSLLGLALLLISFYYQRQWLGRSGVDKSCCALGRAFVLAPQYLRFGLFLLRPSPFARCPRPGITGVTGARLNCRQPR
jgi:uncharacterized membrane protein